MKTRIAAVFFLLLILLSCSSDTSQESKHNGPRLFTRLTAGETGISFLNKVEDQRDFNIFKYRNFYNGGGVAVGDINNDGLPDIFFVANMRENHLYLNKGSFKFEDITARAGVEGNKPWDTGVLMVDVNGDGYLDIYVSNAGNNEGNNHDNDLYINNGDLTFTERAAEYNLAESGFSTHASFFDYDKDGDLDAYLLNNSNVPVSGLGYAADRNKEASDWESVPKQFRGIGHLLLRNDNGKFVNVSAEAGIYRSLIAFGLGVLVTDINGDNYPDIYVSNDFYERDYLYINQKDGTFSEEIENWTSHLCLSAMGIDIADINNDGLYDIFITDMMPETLQRTKSTMEFENYDVLKLKQSRDFYQQYIQNTLQINNGNNSFSEIAYHSGVARTDWSWAGLILDMDNDGFKDIYVTKGMIHDLTEIDFVDFLADEVIRDMVIKGNKDEVLSIIDKMAATALPNYAFHNNGNLTFTNVAGDWGLDMPSFSSGCAYGDLDGDGDLDLVINNTNQEAFVFRNESRQLNKNGFLQFQLEGIDKNRFAIGSTVKLFDEGKVSVQELMPSRGFQSSVDYILTFGLGGNDEIDSISVLWPDDRVTSLTKVKMNQKLKLSQKDAKDWPRPDPRRLKSQPALFSEVEESGLKPHTEDHLDDFDQEPLTVMHISREGPALATGDVNSDGNEDVFVGGAKDQGGQIYLHLGNGKLNPLSNACFIADASFEDTSASFFDADGDGDLDLAVGSGGNIVADKSTYTIRLYLNDGKGIFKRATNVAPLMSTNISSIEPSDFDGDGDIDLFVGSRSVPGVYGVNPKHFLLRNEGNGTFSDVTERHAYDLKNAGMVTGAEWVDIDADGKADLITVSDWGTPRILRNSGKRLSHWPSSLDSLNGWWSAISSADLDDDGDTDLILGNSGSNIPYPGTRANPMRLWINDFDENGTIEQIMTRYENNGDYPVHMRRELTAQIPGLKKQNLKASDYSKRTIQALFPQKSVDNSLVRTVDISESIIAINEGSGRFSFRKLPDRVQWSSVSAIVCTDINNDGITDLLMGGNRFEMKPQFSRQDASFGHVVLGNAEHGFEWKNFNESGFFIKGEIRQLRNFTDRKGNKFVIAAMNNDVPRVFKFNQ